MPWKKPKPKNAGDPHNWTPFVGTFKVIKLKPGEGLTAPMTEEQFINQKVLTKNNLNCEDW